MATGFVKNIKGSKGDTGPMGPVNPASAPTDDAVGQWVSTTGTSATKTALLNKFSPANPAITITSNANGTVASLTEDGVVTTFTYNPDLTMATQTRAGVTRTFTYSNGNLIGAS